jgi:serine/threonine protein kinase
LDVLHECGIIHGDLKPGNVLVYDDGPRGCPTKLADFGLSVEESTNETSLGGTQGWQAPEVAMGRYIEREFWKHAESYSYGLLVWSVMLLDGAGPPESHEESRQNLALRQIATIPDEEHCLLLGAIQSLLMDEPSDRSIQLYSAIKGKDDAVDVP